MKEVLGIIGNMVTLKMSKVIGILAEDNSDVDVIVEILSKYTNRQNFSVKKFVGNGCGKLRNKCESWALNLFSAGCDHVLMFHDRDRHNINSLRKELHSRLCPIKFPNSIIIIPVEELEAWLLSDENAIEKVFKLPKKLNKISNCEQIPSPKEFLKNLVWTIGRKRYLNTVHNKKISESISLDNLRRCDSFKQLDDYLVGKVFS